MRRMALLAVLATGAMMVPAAPVLANDGADRPTPMGSISPALLGKKGSVDVVVRLATPPVAEVIAEITTHGLSGRSRLAVHLLLTVRNEEVH